MEGGAGKAEVTKKTVFSFMADGGGRGVAMVDSGITVGIEVGLDDGLRACEPVGRPREPTTPPPRKVSTGFAVVCIVLAVPLCALVVPDFLLTPLPLLADFGVA